MFQKGSGLKSLFRNISRPIQPILKPIIKGARPILKEAKGIGVGADLGQNLLNDLIAGKSTKDSVKARGKEVKGLAAQRTLQALLKKQQKQNGDTSFTGKQPPTESNLGMSSKTAKRKRSSSKSQTPEKRKRTESQPPKRKQTQKGGAILSSKRKRPQTEDFIHNWAIKRGKRKQTKKRIQTGGYGIGGLLFGGLEKRSRKWTLERLERERKKRAGKKRKKQKGRGKSRKQTNTRKTEKKRKPRKQTGGLEWDIWSRT